MKTKTKPAAHQAGPMEDPIFTPSQAATYVQVTTRTIRNLAAQGLIPQAKLTGKIVRYRRSDLDRALARVTTGAR